MRGLASGPLGVLVMVAPLVAIPVLSTFGIPQFAPLVASPVELDEDPDVITASVNEPPAEPGGSAPALSRPVDDLFAPLGEAMPAAAPRGDAKELAEPASADDTGLVPLVPPGGRSAMLNEARPPASKSRDPALSGWDVIPEPDEPKRPGRRLPDEIGSDTPETKGSESPELPARASAGKADPVRADVTENRSDELTWKEAQRQLNELGIRRFSLESLDDGRFQFLCSASDPSSPQVDRRFTVEADEPLLAVAKALAQIQEWKASE